MNVQTPHNPYLQGPFAPVHAEVDAHDLPVIGELPRDLHGMFVRNGSNPRFAPEGRYHWFDGDGMLHGLRLDGGTASYANRWVRTRGFREEEAAGKALWTGIMERPDLSRRGGPFKDTANTDLVFHDGRLLALWWLGGRCHAVALPSLETLGVQDFKGTLKGGVSAHPKRDPITGELMFMTYGVMPPYLTYGVVSGEGEVVLREPIAIPGARLQHDIAVTERHTILMDLPLLWDPELLARGKTRVRFRRDMPARFGIVPRRSTDVRWFEAASCYMYHTINAWEEGDTVVLVGCRIDDPIPEAPDDRPIPHLDVLRLMPYLHEWRFDLATGEVKERQLDDVMTEFPRMDNRRLGRRTRYAYAPRIAAARELLFDGVIKYDTEAGTQAAYGYGPGRFGGEVVFAPKDGSSAEGDGYLVTFVHDVREGRSEAVVLDAKDVAKGPLARVLLPARVPIGYHAWWVTEPELASQKGAEGLRQV